jgi:diadenosine tetraphosphatase ApaH/serine/threonine PP2A family protein phosphatase
MSGRTIVIGDIHGCYDELVSLLEKVALGSDDRVVAVGDLVVKGWKNREVLDLFIEDRRFSAVLGNHDRSLMRYLRGKKDSLKDAQEKALAELKEDIDRYYLFLQSLPPMIDLGSHLVVHAGVRPGVALSRQKVKDLTEMRTLGKNPASRKGVPWYDVYNGERVVLFGHWPASEPRRGPRAIGLDTGCVYGNRLTAYILETEEILSVRARRAYDPPKRPFI